jgi:hypothetical protein
VPGNPLRVTRAVPVIAVGSLLAFVIMAITRQFGGGCPLPALGVAIATSACSIYWFVRRPRRTRCSAVDVRELAVPLALLHRALGAPR